MAERETSAVVRGQGVVDNGVNEQAHLSDSSGSTSDNWERCEYL